MIRRGHSALAVSLLAHGLTLLALIYLMQRVVLPTPPPETSIALIFAPMPTQVEATPAPAEPSIAEPPPVEQAAPSPAPPEPRAEEAAPAIPQPEAKMEATAPAIPQPAPIEHPVPRHMAAARPPVQVTRPAIAPLSTPAAVSLAPLAPAHPVAGMESDRPPVYPEIARRRGQQGRVVLHVNVSAEGMPVTVTVAESSGYTSLDAAALAAVQQWRFVPATRGSTPVPAVAEVPVRFRLTD
ncbi:MAG TPA: energy transducer TonB [Acetobacteraceae bacterium]|nr:energy transducer TonB [Acetobacteraceae bacterium]